MDVADAFLHIRIRSEEKARWRDAAGTEPLSSWIRRTLNQIVTDRGK
jgi:hypothetical protein